MDNSKSFQAFQAYRPDIDGLRAFAVLGVIAYHAFPEYVRGGFVGVDIFFVISGFLITGIILREISNGTFSLRRFYERRVRRLFPGLLLTVVFSLTFGLLFMFPHELDSLSEQVLASVGFVANFYFWHTADYFSQSPEQYALLHLWTLGLEEQFYLVWPLVLLAVAALRLNLKIIVLVALSVSLLLNLKYYRWSPEWTFFLPPARFWELFAGGALALFAGVLPSKRQRAFLLKEVVSVFSFTVLVLSLFLISSDNFPGLQVIAPVSATTALIWSGPHTAISRLLISRKVLVWFGLISYPLYLYHWPILVFLRGISTDKNAAGLAWLAIGSSIFLAALTYHFIEIPVRKSRTKHSLGTLISLMLLVFVLAASIRGGFLEGRIKSHEVEVIADAVSDWTIPRDNYRRVNNFDLLTLGNSEKQILVFGDSHASQYFSYFNENLSRLEGAGYSVKFATYGGCPPLPDVNRLESGYGCPQFYDFVLDYAGLDVVDSIVVVAWWEHYFGFRFGEPTAEPMLDIGLAEFESVADEWAKDLAQITAKGKKVLILLSNPNSPEFHPNNMVSRLGGGIKSAEISRSAFLDYIAPVNVIIQSAMQAKGINVVDPTEYLCDDGRCSGLDENGRPIYKDSHHLRSSFIRNRADFILRHLGIE